MAASSVTARRYFEALAVRDIDAAVACWAPGGIERLIGQADLIAPDGVRAYFGALFYAFPDFRFEIVDTTTQKERCAVRWRATGTFVGPGSFQGFVPNGARVEIEGCDVLQVENDLITLNEAYLDGADVARQIGVLPPAGSAAEARLAGLANLRTRIQQFMHGARPEAIAPGVWVLRGGRPKLMNAYLIEDDGGITVFDAGISTMQGAIRAAGIHMGGIKRIVLGHADCDHRGGAAGIDAPVYCHPLERSAAQSPSPFRDYWDLTKLSRLGQLVYPKLMPSWDGGALEVAGTVEEGEAIAGFRVVHLPGHAPGLIGLFRDEDRLALVSDLFYTLNIETGIPNAAHVPHPAFNLDTDQARDSIRKLAALQPSVVWSGHSRAVSGDDVELQLQRAAAAPV
jgi:glyoxylase-like metal-dependent hydrolase (beta-lactamase superfamily II)/predicted ester cyclase